MVNNNKILKKIKKKEKRKFKIIRKYDKDTINDIYKFLSFKITKTKRRKRLINKIIKRNYDYFQNYYDNYFNPSPKQSQGLSFSDNVCKTLEKMADYILLTDDKNRKEKNKIIKEAIKNNTYNEKIHGEKDMFIYKFYKDKALFDKTIKEESKNKRIVDMLVLGNNYKLEKKQNYCIDCKTCNIGCSWGKKLLKKGLPAPDFGNEILESYQKLINDCKKLKKFHMCNKIRKDQLIIKDKLKGIIYFKAPLSDSTKIDYFLFNFQDTKHIESLLRFNTRKIKNTENTDLSDLIYDLNNYLEKCELTDNENKILTLWREDGYTQEIIANDMGITKDGVCKLLKSISNKIKKIYQTEYEDWLYLNYLKGTYKTCSKCNEVKLVSKFGKHNITKDGFRSNCLKCENK